MTVRELTPKAAPGRHRQKPQDKPKNKVFYTHIQGLRGLAILLVAFFHVFVGKVSSGVDVFLLLGGIFLIASQTKTALNPQGVTVFQAMIRVIRRLMPALITVISITVALALIIIPSAQWKTVLTQAASGATYWINWLLNFTDQSYARAGESVSIYQHLWSMSVQMQIYLFVIVLIFMLVGIFKGHLNDKKITHIVFSVVAILSLISFSYATWMWLTGNTSSNYYSTFSRFWEIGLGGLIGVMLGKVIFARWIRWTMFIVGMFAICTTGLFLDGANQFPGPLTLIPLIGAIMVVFSGAGKDGGIQGVSELGPVWIIDNKAAHMVGDLAYGLYLWHWPILILGMQVLHPEGYWYPVFGLGVIALSLGLAYITSRLIEKPFQQHGKPARESFSNMLRLKPVIVAMRKGRVPAWKTAGSVALIMLFAVVAVSPYMHSTASVAAQKKKIHDLGGIEAINRDYPGANIILGESAPPDRPPLPDPGDDLSTMMPPTTADACFSAFENDDIVFTDKDGNPCVYGDELSSETLYVLGGSHSEMFLPALDQIGKYRGFKIIPLIKMGCALNQNQKWDESEYPGCIDYTNKVVEYVLSHPPTLGVFHTSTRPEHILGLGPEIVPEGYIDPLYQFASAGIHLYLMRDVPWFVTGLDGQQFDPKICLNEGYTIDNCSKPANLSLNPENPAYEAFAGIPVTNVTHLDVNGALVFDGMSRPIVGNVLAYRDSHHLTAQFVLSLEEIIDNQMFPGMSRDDLPKNPSYGDTGKWSLDTVTEP